MLLLDASHTSHTRAQTGIQRVVRSLHTALEAEGKAVAVCFDPHLGAWRSLDRREAELLRPGGEAARSRGAKWTLAQKLSGHARRLAGKKAALPPADGLVCPELFSPKVNARLPELFSRVRGPRVALFHDAIGLKYPEHTPSGTVARLPGYLRELLQFDGIAAVSEDSAASLRDFWRWLGVPSTPPVQAIPLGLEECHVIRDTSPGRDRPRVLCVATIEGRKNHPALLAACEALWREGLRFELELIGMARADTAQAALDEIERLQSAGRPLVHHGAVRDDALREAYARCTFTVYPSLCEGFGLPVLESLQHGKPCICSGRGALGESARGGGCLMLETADADNLAAALRRLVQNPAEVATLATAARARTFRTWRDYATGLADWMQTLPRRG